MIRRRKLLIALGGLIAFLLLIVVLLHTRAVQQPLARVITDSIESEMGWRVQVEDPRLRLWPARFSSGVITVSAGSRQVASIERLEARWSWAAVLRSPRRIEELQIEGLEIDLREPLRLPSSENAGDDVPVDPWRVFEVGRVRITNSRGAALV